MQSSKEMHKQNVRCVYSKYVSSASHALARTVHDFETREDCYCHQSIMNCLVTKDDFEY